VAQEEISPLGVQFLFPDRFFNEVSPPRGNVGFPRKHLRSVGPFEENHTPPHLFDFLLFSPDFLCSAVTCRHSAYGKLEASALPWLDRRGKDAPETVKPPASRSRQTAPDSSAPRCAPSSTQNTHIPSILVKN